VRGEEHVISLDRCTYEEAREGYDWQPEAPCQILIHKGLKTRSVSLMQVAKPNLRRYSNPLQAHQDISDK
jgi:hypothetical protein